MSSAIFVVVGIGQRTGRSAPSKKVGGRTQKKEGVGSKEQTTRQEGYGFDQNRENKKADKGEK